MRGVRGLGGGGARSRAEDVETWEIVTPCHRVIASGSKLGGYGLGIENKVWLLRHEGIGATGARPDAKVFKLEDVTVGR